MFLNPFSDTVTFELVKNGHFSTMHLFCRIDKYTGQALTKELVYVPSDAILSAYVDELYIHKRNLQETASGYGSKLTTRYKVKLCNGRTYRVYCRCYSNVGTLYILVGGLEKIINEYDLDEKLEA